MRAEGWGVRVQVCKKYLKHRLFPLPPHVTTTVILNRGGRGAIIHAVALEARVRKGEAIMPDLPKPALSLSLPESPQGRRRESSLALLLFFVRECVLALSLSRRRVQR